MFRVTGEVTRIQNKDGKNREGEPYKMDVISVFVRGEAVVQVTRFGRSEVEMPQVGDEVDWAVEVAQRGAFQSASLDSEWFYNDQPLAAVSA